MTMNMIRISMSRRRLLRHAALLGLGTPLVANLLAACARGGLREEAQVSSPTPSPEAIGPTESLIWASSYDPATLDPQMSTAYVEVGVYDMLYDGLTQFDNDMKLRPNLATEWKMLNDTTWQFKLRPDVKWHNGDPFTAEDVKFTIERSFDPNAKTVIATVFNMVKSIEIVDELTINFITAAPDPIFPKRHASWGSYIMPARYFQEVGAEGFNKHPIGTGPFKFVEWIKDDRLVLDANTDYWEGPPNVRRVIVRPTPERASAVAALQTGEAHLIDEVPPDHAEKIAVGPNTKLVHVPYAGYQVLICNTHVPPLDKVEVRQALSFAVDRQSLIDNLLRGYGKIPRSSIVPTDAFYNPDLPPLPYDPEHAMQLLRQANYQGEVIIIEALEREIPLVQAVAAMWAEVGIRTEIRQIEPAVRAQKIRDNAFLGVFPAGPGSSVGDPDGMMFRTMGRGGLWGGVWDNEEFNRLGEEARHLLNEDERRKRYQRMDQIITYEAVPWILLYQRELLYGIAKFIQWAPHPQLRMNFRNWNLSIIG